MRTPAEIANDIATAPPEDPPEPPVEWVDSDEYNEALDAFVTANEDFAAFIPALTRYISDIIAGYDGTPLHPDHNRIAWQAGRDCAREDELAYVERWRVENQK